MIVSKRSKQYPHPYTNIFEMGNPLLSSLLISRPFCNKKTSQKEAMILILAHIYKRLTHFAMYSFQAGCCIPPPDCSFSFVNATDWTPPATLTSTNTDCPLWSNNQTELCYGCQSCKAGVLQNVKEDWKIVAIINIIAFVVIFTVYSVGCCAYRQTRREQRYGKLGF